MIIKFDHITHVVSRENVFMILRKYMEEGYREVFREYNLQNVREKRVLMRYDQVDYDIYFFEAPQKGVDVEVIAYDKIFCGLKERIELKSDCKVEVKTYYPDIVKTVFDALGVMRSDSMYVWGGLLQHGKFFVNVIKGEKIREGFLDDEGIGCITLMVDSIDKTQRKLRDVKLDCSEMFSVCINQQLLNIMFVFTPNKDAIIEIISKAVN